MGRPLLQQGLSLLAQPLPRSAARSRLAVAGAGGSGPGARRARLLLAAARPRALVRAGRARRPGPWLVSYLPPARGSASRARRCCCPYLAAALLAGAGADRLGRGEAWRTLRAVSLAAAVPVRGARWRPRPSRVGRGAGGRVRRSAARRGLWAGRRLHGALVALAGVAPGRARPAARGWAPAPAAPSAGGPLLVGDLARAGIGAEPAGDAGASRAAAGAGRRSGSTRSRGPRLQLRPRRQPRFPALPGRGHPRPRAVVVFPVAADARALRQRHRPRGARGRQGPHLLRAAAPGDGRRGATTRRAWGRSSAACAARRCRACSASTRSPIPTCVCSPHPAGPPAMSSGSTRWSELAAAYVACRVIAAAGPEDASAARSRGRRPDFDVVLERWRRPAARADRDGHGGVPGRTTTSRPSGPGELPSRATATRPAGRRGGRPRGRLRATANTARWPCPRAGTVRFATPRASCAPALGPMALAASSPPRSSCARSRVYYRP